jgi:hypothetical protein
MICITDYYSKTTKTRAKETIKEQDTPQDKERLKITPLKQEKQDKEQRAASASHDKSQENNSKGATDRRRLYHNIKPRSRALQRTLQELLGSVRLHGTMPIGYLVVWIIALYDDREETIANEELIREEKKERKKTMDEK